MLSEPLPKARHQQQAVSEGERFLRESIARLIETGFRVISDRVLVPQCGLELDVLAVNRHGICFPCECKGGLRRGKHPPGFESSDNVKKAIGSATTLANSLPWIDAVATPLIALTTALARPPTRVFDQFANLPTHIIADVIDSRDSAALKMWANMTHFSLEAYLHDTPFLAFRLFGNRHWHLHGTAADYFAQLNQKPMMTP